VEFVRALHNQQTTVAAYRDLAPDYESGEACGNAGKRAETSPGVTLFFNLARALLSPNKVRFAAPRIGMPCKACGPVLNIPDEGLTSRNVRTRAGKRRRMRTR
jgi:hypothetical protein